MVIQQKFTTLDTAANAIALDSNKKRTPSRHSHDIIHFCKDRGVPFSHVRRSANQVVDILAKFDCRKVI